VIEAALQKFGYRARHARNRAEIGAALAAKPMPDLVLLDVLLPDVNGFDVLNRDPPARRGEAPPGPDAHLAVRPQGHREGASASAPTAISPSRRSRARSSTRSRRSSVERARRHSWAALRRLWAAQGLRKARSS